jgi:hypothetical protein
MSDWPASDDESAHDDEPVVIGPVVIFRWIVGPVCAAELGERFVIRPALLE